MHLDIFLCPKPGINLSRDVVLNACKGISREFPVVEFLVKNRSDKTVFELDIYYYQKKKCELMVINGGHQNNSICFTSSFENYSFLIDVTNRLAIKLKNSISVIDPECETIVSLEQLQGKARDFEPDVALAR